MNAVEFATNQELTEALELAAPRSSRQLRLAYHAPEMLKRPTCARKV